MTKINYIIGIPNAISVNSSHFTELCKAGCRVYGTKFSCPPHSSGFRINQWQPFHVIILWAENDIIADHEFTKVKALNSILKSKLNKLLYQYPNTHVLGSGSCRLCKKCNLSPKSNNNEVLSHNSENKINLCKHPDKMFPSLEACGINVEALCKTLGHELQWYRKGQQTPYKYGSVVGLIRGSTETRIREQLDEILGTKLQSNQPEPVPTESRLIRIFNTVEV